MLFSIILLIQCNEPSPAQTAVPGKDTTGLTVKDEPGLPIQETFDTVMYNRLVQALANDDKSGRWPVKGLPYPLPGAILPFHRIVAYYGNLYSTRMGILGELPKAAMLQKLKDECALWQKADSTTIVKPALHYIAVTAQQSSGAGGMYRLRMPFHQIDTIVNWAKELDALVFLDIQVGHSTVRQEVANLEPYLSMPQVHLGIDPEFSMKGGEVPGSKIGHFYASDINDAIDFLATQVRTHHLPPKVLVIHRFTRNMIQDYALIKKVPEVQVVINMDGFGSKILKKSTWDSYIYREPVQFTGFKLFYKNDTKNNPQGLYSPDELMKFTPRPVYIQYQ